jgi:hypothetical protein
LAFDLFRLFLLKDKLGYPALLLARLPVTAHPNANQKQAKQTNANRRDQNLYD